MDRMPNPHCVSCQTKNCRNGKDCFSAAARHQELYRDQQIARLHQSASAIEARHYCKEPRLREVTLFAEELGIQKLGLAFCIGLASEAGAIEAVLSRDFEVISVCCKVSGIQKKSFCLEQIRPEADEVMCNPAGQAELLNRAGTELNILCGLCVGHDAIFSMVSRAPVTTLIAKDRVLGHNPVAAVYCPYIRRKITADDPAP